MVRPLRFQEVAARIAGILERGGAAAREVPRLERVTVDFDASCVLRLGNAPERLGPGEFALLRVFSRNPNRVDNRVVRLRRKLDTRAIVTVGRHGSMFVPPPSVDATRHD